MINRRRLLKLAGAGFLGAAALGTYAFGIEPGLRLRVARYQIKPVNWPAKLNLRIVALADIHACNPWMSEHRIRGISETANSLGGDLIVLLGDYTSGMTMVTSKVHSRDWSRALSTLEAPLGVHAVLGNHDYWDDLTFQRNGGGETYIHRALRNAGIHVYGNDAVQLKKDNQAFWLAGLDDQMALVPSKKYGRKRWKGLDDMDKTLNQINSDDPAILLAHEPDIFPKVPERFALTLSGHTHGGQVRIFRHSPIVPSRYGNRYAYGHVVEGPKNLIVSGGLGCSIMPVRFGVPPELVVVDLG